MLHLRKLNNFSRHLLVQSKCASSVSAKPLVDLTVDKDGIAVLSLQKHPVNSLCVELLNQTADALEEARKNKYEGVILTSALSKIFSAGLDIKVIHNADFKRIKELNTALLRVTWQLLEADYATATAINGFTAAGGCVLSVLTEYRVIVDGQYTFGFNDTALGIVPARWILTAMSAVMGTRRAELAVMASQMFQPTEALKAGLVDDIASSKEEAVEKCKMIIKRHGQYDHVLPFARANMKKKFRESIVKVLSDETQGKNLEKYLNQFLDGDVQREVGLVLESIKNKKKTLSVN